MIAKYYNSAYINYRNSITLDSNLIVLSSHGGRVFVYWLIDLFVYIILNKINLSHCSA